VAADRTEAFPPPNPAGIPAVEGASPPQPTEAATLLVTSSSPGASGDFGSVSDRSEGGAWPTVEGYEILAEMGRGGMGVVYKARQAGLKRIVALKMILSGGHASAVELARFKSEAEAIARLQHPNIVHINAVGESEGRPYFSLEFVDGGSLADRLDGTPWPPADAALIVETLAQAMQAAHEQNIIHRDLKPANILLQKRSESRRVKVDASEPSSLTSEFSPKITDFGLAKQMDSERGETRSGAIMGTPSYMAPEQAGGKGKEIGPATDVYALGAILYELLTGRPPFKAATPLDTVLQVVGEDPVPPRRLQPKLPRDLDTICLKCLEKSPAKRYTTSAELAEDLVRWRQLQPIRARRIGRAGRAARWCRRNPVLAAVSSAAVAAIVALTAIFTYSLWLENGRTRDALHQAKIEEDQAQDNLVRSLFEQARAIRLSNQAGRRWQALKLLEQAEKLRDRKRLVEAPGEGLERSLLSEADLRAEAAAALLLEDARVSRQVSLAAASFFPMQVSPDGRHAMAWWIKPLEKKFGVRVFDLSDGRSLGEITTLPLLARHTIALSPDHQMLAFIGFDDSVSVREFPSGNTRPPMRWPKDPEDKPLSGIERTDLLFSPDSRALVGVRVTDKATDLVLWELGAASSRHLTRLDVAIDGVAFRADCLKIAYALGGRKIAVTDLEIGGNTIVVELPLKTAGVEDGSRDAIHRAPLAWSPIEPLLAVATVGSTGKGTILFWDVDRGEERARWEGDFDPSNVQLAFAPNGRKFAIGGKDGDIRCFSVADQREMVRLAGAHHDEVRSLRWESDDRLLSAGMFNTFKAWEFSDQALRSSALNRTGHVMQLRYSPHGKWLALIMGEPERKVVLVDRATGEVRHRFDVPETPRRQFLLFRPDGGQLAWCTPWEAAVIWDLNTGTEIARRESSNPEPAPFFSPAFRADGRLVTTAVAADRLVIRDLFSRETVGVPLSGPTPAQLIEAGVRQMELSADGSRLAGLTNDSDPTLQPILLWKVESGEPDGELKPADKEVTSLTRSAFDPGGRRLLKVCIPASYDANVGSSEPRISVWDVDAKERRFQIQRTVLPSAHAFSADGKLLAIGFQNGFVELWDVEGKQELFRWQPRGQREVRQIAFSPDNAQIATSDGAAPVQLLHLAELRRQLAGMGLDR
jgi:WD40 repeat protein/tRNA A-37 threonylcarbamoyl transferase component Bud32